MVLWGRPRSPASAHHQVNHLRPNPQPGAAVGQLLMRAVRVDLRSGHGQATLGGAQQGSATGMRVRCKPTAGSKWLAANG